MAIENQGSLSTTYTDPTSEEAVTQTITSNTVTTQNMSESVTKEETSTSTTIKPSEQVTIDATITNGSTETMTNVVFTEVLSAGLEFVAGSLELNGEAQADANPTTGFTIETLNAGDTALIAFKVQLTGTETTTTVTSSGTLSYTADEQTLNDTTNTLEFTVQANLISVVKATNKNVVVKGDTIHYTITITNNGTYANTALTLTDTLSTETTFVAGSVTINGEANADADPTAGFTLPDLDASGVITVGFDVTVN